MNASLTGDSRRIQKQVRGLKAAGLFDVGACGQVREVSQSIDPRRLWHRSPIWCRLLMDEMLRCEGGCAQLCRDEGQSVWGLRTM
ncbi:hypothetical protein RESH_01825 [Rhodopirellula europaea SH398]|uniref:Uncharacterized protein n=1 Tax=Rhodopirellula europaea SH398 TaxID=1263868 RepID=M5S708_9BACT|nr:hypothetical protein RESH_01825 [Rhodopirellula europaea SH398]